MPTGNRNPNRWKQSEATRAVKAMAAAGLKIERVEIATNGHISLFPANGQKAKTNEWDAGIAKDAADVVAERLR